MIFYIEDVRNQLPQYEFQDWYEQLGGNASLLANAIIDRIVYDSYRINITSIDEAHGISMREFYDTNKDLCEKIRTSGFHWSG